MVVLGRAVSTVADTDSRNGNATFAHLHLAVLSDARLFHKRRGRGDLTFTRVDRLSLSGYQYFVDYLRHV